ncbi:MAG: diguanylate cyclase [Pyrinomonadaceae bacterium]
MNNERTSIDARAVDSVASATGLAVAVVDSAGRQVAVANNNSICASLNPSDDFSPECAEYCGRAVEMTANAGEPASYECHAGLECRAVRIGPDAAVVVGRTFLKSENYRSATKRAIDGDWSQYSPAAFFENILLSGSAAVLDKAAEAALRIPPPPPGNLAEPQIPTPKRPGIPVSERLTGLVARFNRDTSKRSAVNPDPEQPVAVPLDSAAPKQVGPDVVAPEPESRGAQAQAWRSFFSSLLKTDYGQATDSILEFLASQFELKSLMWLDRSGDRLAATAGFGDLKNRRLQLGMAASDARLIDALRSEMPFELGERKRDDAAARKMHLFPIGVGDEVSAAIAVLDEMPDDAVKRQIARTALSIAPQIEILRLRSAVNKSETLSTAVRRFGENLKRIDADDLWLRLTQNAAEMLRAERASLLIYDEKSDALAMKALVGAKSMPGEGEAIGQRVAMHVFQKSLPVAVADVRKTSLPPAPADREYKTFSFLSCPIAISGRTIGVMNFADRACGLAFDKNSLELFLAIAPQLAVAVDRAFLKEMAGKFEQLSVTDALTGLLNRRYMEARLTEEVKRSNRHGFPMSFMMLDVDNFKSYNDAFGHPAGDEALKIVSGVIRDTLRGADVAARFGGEEFAILLPQTTGDEASTIAERIRRNIEHAKFAHRRVTTSIGVASCSAALCVSADLISAADQALYEAKRSGRNRVLAFEEMAASSVGSAAN